MTRRRHVPPHTGGRIVASRTTVVKGACTRRPRYQALRPPPIVARRGTRRRVAESYEEFTKSGRTPSRLAKYYPPTLPELPNGQGCLTSGGVSKPRRLGAGAFFAFAIGGGRWRR